MEINDDEKIQNFRYLYTVFCKFMYYIIHKAIFLA